MRAAILRQFGPPEVLAVEEAAEPSPIPTEVKVRVRAAGINPVDLKTRAGKGVAGVLGEPPLCIGWDVSGEVVEVGGGVTRFAVGEEAFGMPWFPREAGAYAEFVTAPSRHFATKPHVLSHEEAAALPLAGLTELTRRAAESSRRVTGFLVEPDPVGLAGLDALIEAGKLQVHVDQVFDLEQVVEAHRAAEDHHGGGKIVLRV